MSSTMRLWLLASAVLALQGHASQLRQNPSAMTTFQDMADTVLSAKSKVGELLDHLSVDNDRLRQDFQAETSKASDLKIQKQSLETNMAREKQHLTAELAQFKAKMVEKIAQLQAANRQLEDTNTKLVQQSEKCSAELEGEKARKDALVKKVQRMGSLFNHQQVMVRKIIEQQQQRVSDEVTSDVRDAVMTAGDPAGAVSVAAAQPEIIMEPTLGSSAASEPEPQQPLFEPPTAVAPQTPDLDAMLRDTLGEARAIAEAPLRVASPAQSHHVPQTFARLPQQNVQAPAHVPTPVQAIAQRVIQQASVQAPVQAPLQVPVQAAVPVPVHATKAAIPQPAAAAAVMKVQRVPVAKASPVDTVPPKVVAHPARAKAAAVHAKMINQAKLQSKPQSVAKPQARMESEPQVTPEKKAALRGPAHKSETPEATAADAEDEEELVKAVGATVPGATGPPHAEDAPEDDDQLKMLRSEVAKLEQSVKAPEKSEGGDADLDDLLSNI